MGHSRPGALWYRALTYGAQQIWGTGVPVGHVIKAWGIAGLGHSAQADLTKTELVNYVMLICFESIRTNCSMLAFADLVLSCYFWC